MNNNEEVNVNITEKEKSELQAKLRAIRERIHDRITAIDVLDKLNKEYLRLLNRLVALPMFQTILDKHYILEIHEMEIIRGIDELKKINCTVRYRDSEFNEYVFSCTYVDPCFTPQYIFVVE